MVIKFSINFMSTENKNEAQSRYAREFSASKKKVETPVGKPSEASRIREARARVTAVREAQAAAKDAEALIKQREALEDLTDEEIGGAVGSLREEGTTGPTAEELGTGQALAEAFKKHEAK